MPKFDLTLDKLVSLAKRRGFIYPGSEIYGGLGGTWDYGPLGVDLKRNISNAWWKRFVQDRPDMFGLDSAILMHSRVWEASGHTQGFTDPLVECKKCKRRFRADQISGKCPECGGELGDVRPFNLMFKTYIGSVEDSSAQIYLRPENAQGMFVDFKQVLDSLHPKLPFGIAQIGRVFRNEISPGEFLFRVREFDLMEFEYFIHPKDWENFFEAWLKEISSWLDFLGLDKKKIFYHEISDGDRAHYSKRTVDIEYQFPFGMKELCAVAYRADHDLKQHQKHSKKDLTYFDDETKERFLPHVLEPTFGLDRALLAVLTEAYREETIGNETSKGSASKDSAVGEKRIVLKLPKVLAPYKVAVFPLLANKSDLVKKAEDVYGELRTKFATAWDDRGNIGKRYRAQDEIGTPWCVTIDFDTLSNGTVTVRDRDSMKQERIKVENLVSYFLSNLA